MIVPDGILENSFKFVWNSSIFYLLLWIAISSFVLHLILAIFFGLSVKFINPFKLEIYKLGFKNKNIFLKIKSIRSALSFSNLLSLTLIVDELEITIRKSSSTKDDDQTTTTTEKDKKKSNDEIKEDILNVATQEPIRIFPKDRCLKHLVRWYLLYFRFVKIKLVNLTIHLEEYDLTLTTESSSNRVTMENQKDGSTSVKLSATAFNQGLNSVDIFQSFVFEVSGNLDLETGILSKAILATNLKDVNIPVYKLIKAIAPLHKLKEERLKQKNRELTEYDYMIHVYKKICLGAYFVKLVEQISIQLHKVSIHEIPLAAEDIVLCQQYNPKVFMEINVNSINSHCKRMYFDYPGYGLLYSYDDKPYHIVHNYTGVSLSLQNLSTNQTKEILNVPVITFTGHSNLAFQTLEATKSSESSHSKVDLVGHVAEPVLDLSTDEMTTALISAFDYLIYQHGIKSSDDYKDEQEANRKIKEENKKIRDEMNIKFQKFWPIVIVKLGIVNPTITIKDNFDEKFYRILALRQSSIVFECKTYKEFKQNVMHYYSNAKLDVHNSSIDYKDTCIDLEKTIMNLEDFSIKQRYDRLPLVNLQSCLSLQNTNIDLSNIKILHGINHIFTSLETKVLNVYSNFLNNVNGLDFYCSKENNDTHVFNGIGTEDFTQKSAVELLNDKLPYWINNLKVQNTGFCVTLGSRSLLLSKELMKVLEPQSKNDFVSGELRKIEITFEESSLEYFLGQIEDFNNLSMSSPSSLEDDDKGLMDNRSESSSETSCWKVRSRTSKLIFKAITDSSSNKNTLNSKVFLKLPLLKLDINPSISNKQQISFDCNIQRIELMYSIITHFTTLSTFHLLRNTIFEFLLTLVRPKTDHGYQKIRKNSGSSSTPSFSKRILHSIQFALNIDFLALTIVLPDKLKCKLESTSISALGDLDSPVLINSDSMRLCTESPTTPGFWVRFATGYNGSTVINIPKILEKSTESWIDFANDNMHITIPNQLIMYKVFNNISILVKTIKQLHHSFKENNNKIVIYPHPEEAKNVPKMNLKSKRMILSLEDDPFEAELNIIFQIGLMEQKMRLEKMKIHDQMLSDELLSSNSKASKSQTFPASNKTESDTDASTTHLSTEPSNSSKLKKAEKLVHHSQSLSNFPRAKSKLQKPEFAQVYEIRKKAEERLYKLRENFSKSWILRVKSYKAKMDAEFERSFQYIWGNISGLDQVQGFDRKVLEFSSNPSLFSLILENVDLDVSKPDFGENNLSDFIYDVGKGVPKDTKYSTLIPVSLDLKLSELRCHLRDYPLPMIHMPAITKNQPKGLPAIRIYGNLIISEDMIRSEKEIRETYVRLVPGCEEFDEDNLYSIEVPKTLTPIKFYTSLDLEVNSELNTKVTWGNSYQPCIQQIMLSFDDFTKPPIDLSEKVGFWDKIRANFHARFRFTWNHGGQLQIIFKGSKNPYSIGGIDSGFMLGFKDDVTLTINERDESKQFIEANSGEVMFSVPNHFAEPLPVWCRPTTNSVFLSDTSSNFQMIAFGYYLGNYELADPIKVHHMKNSYIQKEAIKLGGGVSFNFAVMFERKTENGKDRTSESRPHYDIVLCNPKYVQDRANYDAYKNFRSQYIHLEFDLVSTEQDAYNTIQLTPITLEYFFSWWKMFDNSLPVRHGRLFGPDKPTTKFSRHLSTLKYQAKVEPLFITIVNHDVELGVRQHDQVHCVGVKGRASKFTMDLHQRKELVFDHNQKLGITKKMMKNKFNIGGIDIVELDVRTLKAVFKTDTEINRNRDRELYKLKTNKAYFRSFDGDSSWFDFADFAEIGASYLPDLKCHVYCYPLMYTPRFIYIKKNSYGDKYQVDVDTGEKIRPFGNEEFHDCSLRTVETSLETMLQSFDERVEELEAKVEENNSIINSTDFEKASEQEIRHVSQLKLDTQQIQHAIVFVQELSAAYRSNNPKDIIKESDFQFVVDSAIADSANSSFKNSFTIHNMMLKWNDKNRDIFYRFIYLFEMSSAHKKFLKYKSMAQIDEVVQSQVSKRNLAVTPTLSRIESTLTAARCHTQFSADSDHSKASERLKNFQDELRELGANFSFKTHDDYKVKLISPQIQLQSAENKDSVLLVTAPNIELNIIAFDANDEDDEDENVFQQRLGAIFSDASIFMFYKDQVINTGKKYLISRSYGSNTIWPPWLGVELCYDASLIKEYVLLNKTTFVIQYDKAIASYVLDSKDDHSNKLSCDLSQTVFHCDAKQYFSLYTIVLNLLIYSDPKNRQSKERESKMLLRFNTNDLSAIRERITDLQYSVKEANLILGNLASRRSILDDGERSDLYSVSDLKQEALSELRFLMRIVLLGYKEKNENTENYLEWTIRADDIKLHMLDESRKPFLDVILFNCHFKRIERSDRSNKNVIFIDNIEVLNLDEQSKLPVLFSSSISYKNHRHEKPQKQDGSLISISWQMDYPVGGIRVMRKFFVDLLPIQISIEELTGEKIMKYFFPNASPLFAKYGGSDDEDYGLTDNESFIDDDALNDDPTHKAQDTNGKSKFTDVSNHSFTIGDNGSRHSKTHHDSTSGINGFKHKNNGDRSSVGFATPRRSTASSKSNTDANIGSISSRSNGTRNNLGSIDEDEDEMIMRSSNYLSIISFSLRSSEICITFRGVGAKRLANVSNFVFNLPEVALNNETVTLLDLTMVIKKSVFKAILAHTGGIIGNKLTKHDPTKHLTNISGYASARIDEFTDVKAHEIRANTTS
ncbi:hypothetical protein WICMUC_001769 [Wickerhamomyces mucosus]|uniref:Uncharacterized protein n=1 Tax=Wickerhamomyces mucosus TaxID=1378264 RepID=A0A9P8PRQ4_9ASCO|nr:hypothetical protein WICMUC_001769 [Wickerhamomyces mucosus]